MTCSTTRSSCTSSRSDWSDSDALSVTPLPFPAYPCSSSSSSCCCCCTASACLTTFLLARNTFTSPRAAGTAEPFTVLTNSGRLPSGVHMCSVSAHRHMSTSSRVQPLSRSPRGCRRSSPSRSDTSATTSALAASRSLSRRGRNMTRHAGTPALYARLTADSSMSKMGLCALTSAVLAVSTRKDSTPASILAGEASTVSGSCSAGLATDLRGSSSLATGQGVGFRSAL
mmetsp:Transcript_270/g.649  ORF Transcript_270/g.649 Transcript_270/m.649 type:complete len:228 (-) Transcript_270:1802-2485(-)